MGVNAISPVLLKIRTLLIAFELPLSELFLDSQVYSSSTEACEGRFQFGSGLLSFSAGGSPLDLQTGCDCKIMRLAFLSG